MMQKHAQPMSPRTQSFAQGMPSGDEETHLFEEGFSQMAYNVLVSKFPDLIQNIVTFKILDTDLEHGAGAGCFVVQYNNDVFYIPVIMADNQIKPLDMFYHKGLNVFLPLNNDWLEEVNQLTLDEMGDAVKAPRSLRRNVDLRHVMVPPTTGRYAYAAAREPLTDEVMNNDLYHMLAKLGLEKVASDDRKLLLPFLTNAPDTVKEAFHTILKRRPKLAAKVAMLYGLEPLAQALARTKTAAGPDAHGGGLFVADSATPASEFKHTFGDKAPEAFQGMLLDGYVAKDNRKGLNRAVQIQGQERLKTPSDSGFYKIFTTDGEVQEAFILHNPRYITNGTMDRKPEGRHGKRHDTLHFGQHNKDFIAITSGGKWVRTHELIAEPLQRYGDGPEALFKVLASDAKGTQPTVGSRGMFVVKTGQTYIGTEPVRIKSVTNKDSVRRVTLDDFDETVLVTDKNAAKMGLHRPKGSNVVYLPPNATFIKLQDEPQPSTSYMRSPTQVTSWFKDKFDSMGANSATVKNAGAGMFSIDGDPPVVGLARAMKAAALKHNIPFSEAEILVKRAAAHPNSRAVAYVLTDPMWTKMAQVPMMGDAMPPPGAAPPPGGDPSMAGGAPPAPPPPPPAPSPLDIAMGEAQTQIQQQTSDLQAQQMALQDKSQTLMMVQQRAQEIATGGAAAVQQGAPPMMSGPQGGPPPQGEGAPPPQGAMPPGGAPPPGGAMPPQGGQPQGVMGQQPAPEMAGPGMGMGATMNTEAPSAMEIQQQVNPQFLEQAATLDDTGTFDAAAISSMAQSPSFRDMVVDYVPTMERSLDNIARIMLSMWMQEAELKQRLGDEAFSDLEDNTRAVFEGLGNLVLQMNKNAIVAEEAPPA